MVKFYWSATKVNIANYCTMRYVLRYVRGEKPLRLSVYVKGSLLHGLIENFWDKLGTPKEVLKKSSGKKYFDAQSFSKYAQGKWTSIIIADKNAKDKIYWSGDSEQWFIRNDLPQICNPLFNSLVNEGRPLFSELGLKFKIDDEIFKGYIDEVRIRNGKIVVRDYKSGYPHVGEMKLKHDPQLTIYNVGLCHLIKTNEKIRNVLGLEGKVGKFMENNLYTSKYLEEEFYMIEAFKKEKDPIHATFRNDNNFLEVLNMVRGVREKALSGQYYPERGKKCDGCDMKFSCDKQLENVSSGKDLIGRNNQIMMNFSVGEIPKKQIKNIKNLDQTRMHFRYNQETITSKKDD